jgi:hypothetical protein
LLGQEGVGAVADEAGDEGGQVMAKDGLRGDAEVKEPHTGRVGVRSGRQRSARGKRVKDKSAAEQKSTQKEAGPDDKTPRTPGGSIDEVRAY